MLKASMPKIHIGEFLREDFGLNPNQLSHMSGCSEEKAIRVLEEKEELTVEELKALAHKVNCSEQFLIRLADKE